MMPVAHPGKAPKPAGLRLHFLDGLRALASLYVLVFHALTVRLEGTVQLSWPLRVLRGFFGFGHLSVVFFIVLSGFSLMLPIARSGELELSTPFREYVRRRARRIMPPYYASLVLALIPLVALKLYGARLGVQQQTDGALSVGSLVSHLLLVHNLSFDWVYRINGPAWSVATEWQIYFLLPLVLLPLWKRTGAVFTIVAAWAVGALPSLMLPQEINFFWACPWFVGSFAMGMAGAMIFFAPSTSASPLRSWPWFLLAVLSFAPVVFLAATGRTESWPYATIDLFVSVFALCLICAGAQHATRSHAERRNLALEALAWKPLVALGGFSYSLYLIQHPFLRLSEKVVARFSLSHESALLFHLLLVIPFITASAWLFAEFFEKPFTGGGVVLPWLKTRLSKPSVEGVQAAADG